MYKMSKNLGTVKWFNSTRGFGFITNLEDNADVKDLFVHHSGITVTNDVYKTLNTGEYVSFNIMEKDGKKYAVDITGLKGGKLLCEHPKMKRGDKDNISE